jgi:phospholipase/carboxylesterase
MDLEILPERGKPEHLFFLFHGLGASASDLLPLAQFFRNAVPQGAYLLPDGVQPYDGGGPGRQWFSFVGLSNDNRLQRIQDVLPIMRGLIQRAQARFVLTSHQTTLIGFSQGAILALEYTARIDDQIAQVLAFSGRYADLPSKAPAATHIHLLHGQQDGVIEVCYAQQAYERLTHLGGHVSLDIDPVMGHGISSKMLNQAMSHWRVRMGMGE